LAEDDKGELIAFSHFRFDMDDGIPVLYWYVYLSMKERRTSFKYKTWSVDKFKFKEVFLV